MIQNYPISVSFYSCLSRPQNLEKYSIFSESVRKTPPKWHFRFQRQHRGIYIFLIQERKEKKKHIFKIFYWDVSSCSFVFLFYFCVLSTEKKEIFNKISIISLQEFYFEVLHILMGMKLLVNKNVPCRILTRHISFENINKFIKFTDLTL